MQGNAYHSTVHTSSFKYGFSSAASDSYYSFGHAYEINCFTPQLDAARRMWDDPAPSNIFDSPQLFLHGNLGVETRTPSAEECKLDLAFLFIMSAISISIPA